MTYKTSDPVAVPNLDSRLSGVERVFRKYLLDRLIAAGRPLTLAELTTSGGPSPSECLKQTSALRAKGLLIQEEDGAIAGAYPVSARPTAHRVRLANGREFFAMCAIDALGCAFEFGRDVAVFSACSHCRVPIMVRIERGALAFAEPAGVRVLHVDLDHYADWAGSC